MSVKLKRYLAKFILVIQSNFNNLLSSTENVQEALEVIDDTLVPATTTKQGLLQPEDKIKIDNINQAKLDIGNKDKTTLYPDIDTLLFDEDSGLLIDEIDPTTLKVKIGSHFKYITDGTSVITAEGGEDVLTIRGEGAIQTQYNEVDKSIIVTQKRYTFTSNIPQTEYTLQHNLGSQFLFCQFYQKDEITGKYSSVDFDYLVLDDDSIRVTLTEARNIRALITL